MSTSTGSVPCPSGMEWLGDVPSDWDIVSGRRVFEAKREPARESDEQLSATQRYGVVPQREFMEREDQKVMLALSGVGNFRHVEQNDFVISLRSFEGGIEHSAFTGCVSPAYTVLRLRNEGEPSYFRYLLKSGPYIAALQSTTDSLRDGKSIKYEQFGSIPLPLPPLPKQAAIAAFLDRETSKIDALVEDQKRLIELLKEKRQAVISHAVTKGLNPNARMKPSGVEWLGDVPEHWEVQPLRRFVDQVRTGRTPSTVPAEEDGGDLPWFTPGDFSDTIALHNAAKSLSRGTADMKELAVFPLNSVLVVSIGATLGKVGLAAVECSANQQINAIIPSTKLDPAFLAWSLSVKTDVMRYLSNASTIGIMNQEKTKDIVIPVPPIDEQQRISKQLEEVCEQISELTSAAQHAVEILQERRSALISAAVTGKIDVRSSAQSTEVAA